MSAQTPASTEARTLASIESLLKREVALLTQLVGASQMVEPNYRRPLQQLRTFGWASIGATVLESDEYGPTCIEWGGHWWLRRNAADKKFGMAVWYSRHAGGSGDNATYYTLIKFTQKMEAEPMDGRVAEVIPASRPAAVVTAVPVLKVTGSPDTKDWYADALTCRDALSFDTAVQRHREGYYTGSQQVATAREWICGPWQADPAYAKAAADALVTYADEITAYRQGGAVTQEQSKTAVAKAKNKFQEGSKA